MKIKGKKIGIIGCGNMGAAIARGLVEKGIFAASSVFLNDKKKVKARVLARATGARSIGLAQLACASDFLLVAVKPQDSAEILQGLSRFVSKKAVVISVMAGVKIKTMMRLLKSNVAIARAMPNMGAVIGKSVTCVSFNRLVRDKKSVTGIFSGVGEVIEVNEHELDAVTALAGSGPAYFFYLADAMIRAGKKMGLAEKHSRKLVLGTLEGASAILKGSGDISIAELIAKVASKGGTTEAALEVFRRGRIEKILEKAILKARARSRELAR